MADERAGGVPHIDRPAEPTVSRVRRFGQMRVAAYIACFVLFLSAAVFSLLAVLATGGNSAFAGKSSWICAPWLVALILTLAAIVATTAGHLTSALALVRPQVGVHGNLVHLGPASRPSSCLRPASRATDHNAGRGT